MWLKKHGPEVIFVFLSFFFSFWLMTKTFGYDQQSHTILIATKAWSDFASHLPLIRSFSWGNNFPPEFPLFPGEPIRYHFLFYAFAGFLERIGLPLDWALNLPSIFGFWALLLIIYFIAKLLFDKKGIAFLAVVFFLFNGSLSFLEFFRQHPFSRTTLSEIVTNKSFPSFGPYDDKIVSAFWNLNIYTNQRHLAFSFSLFLLVIFFLLNSPSLSIGKMAFLIAIFSLLPFLHKGVFFMLSIVLLSLFFFFPKLRKSIFFLFLLSLPFTLPQIFYLIDKNQISSFKFFPGYLIAQELSLVSFLKYWFHNLGLFSLLIPLGFIFSSKFQKKILMAMSSLFLLGNLFQFSPEMAANHKFFNLWLIVGNIFAAYFLVFLWQKKIMGKILVISLLPFLVLSGIIDFFAVKNDIFYQISDAPKNTTVAWIKDNTPPDAVFLNSSYLYHPASLAGRKIFLGWPYFPWSTGYDTHQRDRLMRKMLNPTSLQILCQSLKENKIDYLAIENWEDNPDFEVNYSFFEENFISIYKNPKTDFAVFSVSQSCSKH